MIITITLNPAFDLHYRADGFLPYKECLAEITLTEAGGKGVNVSRALDAFGVKNKAFLILGDSEGNGGKASAQMREQPYGRFEKLLNKDGVDYEAVYADGVVRENITIHTVNMPETRISTAGFTVSPNVLDDLYEKTARYSDSDSIIVFAGSIPKGIEKREAVAFLKRFAPHKIAVDCGSFGMAEYEALKPFMIKPNEQETEKLFPGCDDLTEAGSRLIDIGVEHVLFSRGADGIMYFGKADSFGVTVPKITPVSTVGAGDATVAGFVGGLYEGKTIRESVRLAASFGTAACLTNGSRPPKRDDIISILDSTEYCSV